MSYQQIDSHYQIKKDKIFFSDRRMDPFQRKL